MDKTQLKTRLCKQPAVRYTLNREINFLFSVIYYFLSVPFPWCGMKQCVMAAWWLSVFCAHIHTHATHSSIWALQGIREKAGVNELVITANSFCHQGQSRPGASVSSPVSVYICVSVSLWRKIRGHIPKWPSQRRNPVVPLTGISLTALAWGFRTQTHTYTLPNTYTSDALDCHCPLEWSLN